MSERVARLGASRGGQISTARPAESGQQYLKKVCGLAFPDDGATWATITALAELRNVIAHREGDLKKSDKKAWRYIEDHGDLAKLDPEHRLLFSEAFVPAVLDTFSAFMAQVYAVLPDDGADRN